MNILKIVSSKKKAALYGRLAESRRKAQEAQKAYRSARHDYIAAVKELDGLKSHTVIQTCKHCGFIVRVLWDVERDGLSAYCPYCGHCMILCSACPFSCNYDYATEHCSYMEGK